MRKVLVGVLAMGLAGAATIAAAGAWATYSNAEYGFSAELPGQPEITRQDTPTPAGSAPTLMAVMDLGPRGAVLVGATDYSALPDSAQGEASLDAAVDSSLQSMQAQADTRSSLTVRGAPAREVSFHAASFVGRGRWIRVGKRGYGVMALGPPASGVPQEYERVAQSLTFKPGP